MRTRTGTAATARGTARTSRRRPMTFPLMVLAVGAVVAGFVGIPAALGGGNAIEHFLEPSFTAPASRTPPWQPAAHGARPPPRGERGGRAPRRGGRARVRGRRAPLARRRDRPDGVLGADRRSSASWSRGASTCARPEIAERLAARFAGPHRVLTNKYYVDELYDATVIRGTMASASGLWTVRPERGGRRRERLGLADASSRRGSRTCSTSTSWTAW